MVGFQPIIENFMNLFMYLLCIQRQGLLTVFALNTIELHIYYCSFTNYYHKFQEWSQGWKNNFSGDTINKPSFYDCIEDVRNLQYNRMNWVPKLWYAVIARF